MGSLTWLPPYRIEIELVDGQAADLVTGAGGNFLISERFRDLYMAAGLKGFAGFEAVDVARVKPRRFRVEELPHYYRT